MSGALDTPPGDLSEALEELDRSHSGRGVAGIDVRVVDRGDGPTIVGRVLTFKQARAVRDIARRHDTAVDMEVVADPVYRLELGWVEPALEVVDLWREPDRVRTRMGRQTQHLGPGAAPDGPLRLLGSQGDLVLLQGLDLAMGWARAAEVQMVNEADARPAWEAVTRASEGAMTPALPGTSAAGVVARAREALGSRYLWGGRGGGGFDCSGLVQRAYETTGVLLPRHTAEQRRVGRRVTAPAVQPGDLLFARPREHRVGHVMLMTTPGTVLHACRTEKRVIEEPLDTNAARYLHQGWRRPVRFDP